MPRVLRIINRLNLGGPTFNAAYLTKYLAPEFETMLVAGMIDNTEESSEFITQKLDLHPVHIPEMFREINFKKDREAYKKIKKIIADFKPDIVHTHAAKAGTLGRLAAHNMKVPVVLHTFHGHVFHSYFGKYKTRVFLEIEKYLARRSTRIIAISDVQKKELGEIYRVAKMEKIEVVPLGFDLKKFQEHVQEKRNSFRKKYLIDDDEIVISIVGRMVPVKNHTLFLNAAKQILDSTKKKVRFFIIGDGEEKENILSLTRSLNIPFAWFPENQKKEVLTFTSWQKDVDVVNAGSDIIALSSFNEGTPVSLIEAQASNKPIVTTDVGGIRDIVLPNETALISANNDLESFTKNLSTLIEDDSLRQSMGKKGALHVMQKFSYQRLVGDMSTLYNKLLFEYQNKQKK